MQTIIIILFVFMEVVKAETWMAKIIKYLLPEIMYEQLCHYLWLNITEFFVHYQFVILWFEGQTKKGLADNLSCTCGFIIGTEINVAVMIIDFKESSCPLFVFVNVCSVIMYRHINLLLSVDCVRREGQ